jgi:hypothetical protein
MPDTSSQRRNLHLEHEPSDETDLLIETINSMDLGWKADVCKLQSHHASYGQHCKEVNLSQKTSSAELDALLEEKTLGEGAEFGKAHEEAQKYSKKYAKPQDIPDGELPDNFDWRSVGGFNFLGELRDQSHCGSCYTFSFV